MQKTLKQSKQIVPQMVIYQTQDGQAKLRVMIEDETVWLTQDHMDELFDKGRTTITEHIHNVFQEGELDEKGVCREFRRTGPDGKNSTCAKLAQVQVEGQRKVTRNDFEGGVNLSSKNQFLKIDW